MWIEDFIALFSHPSPTVNQIDEAQRIKYANLPKSLFKFRGINKYSLSNLETDTVWVTSANDYNDPYDSALQLSYISLLDNSFDIRKMAEKVPSVRQHLNEKEIKEIQESAEPRHEFVKRMLEKDTEIPVEQHKEFTKALNLAIDKVSESEVEKIKTFNQSGAKICSFSTLNSSIVMWSHYAANHTGFCIEYDISNLPHSDLRTRGLFPVIYTHDLFDVTDYFRGGFRNENFNNLFPILAAMHKSPEWEYEREWRFIFPLGTSADSWNMGMPTPKAIYLGTRISLENADKLTRIVLDKKIDIYEMQLSSTKFALEPKRLDL